jgi:very-short-patch-repair endonuclease
MASLDHTTDALDSDKAALEPELCPNPQIEATHSVGAPIRGSLCSFEHPREAGERELARLAERQHWCLHRRQLIAAGIGRGGIRGRVQRGQLQSLLSDVYLYGPRNLDPLTMSMAVALHLKGDGVICAESATWIWELSDIRPKLVAILVAGRNAHPLPGVTLHRTPSLHSDDIRWRKGVPVTSPARSLIDFAGSGASVPRVESALAMLRRQPLATDRQIRATLERLPANHSGAPLIRKLLELPPGQLVMTRSIYERKLRKLLKQAGLPMPLSNHGIAGKERDLAWPHAKLILEFDGWEFHKDKFEDDRLRDAKAAAAGWRVIRLTADRVDTEPYAVIAEIAAALAAAA